MSGFTTLDNEQQKAWQRYLIARRELERQRVAAQTVAAHVRLYERLDAALGPLPLNAALRAQLAERRALALARWANIEQASLVASRRASRNLERTGLVPPP